MTTINLWGFDGSTYVRTVKMLLSEKGVHDYQQMPIDVLKGEPKSAEHRLRHPFGKVPVADIDGFRIIETPAIVRYLNTVLPGPSLIPVDPKDVARMDMVMSIIDSYGYNALVGGVAAYHLFPDFVGGRNPTLHDQGITVGKLTINTLMKHKGGAPYLAGPNVSLADLYLAPIMSYVAMTPHMGEFLVLAGFKEWWSALSERPSYLKTQPA